MIYIVTDQYGRKSLQHWDLAIPANNSFMPLTDAQMAFYQNHSDARLEEIEICEVFSEYYFVTDQDGRKSIQKWAKDMRSHTSFEIFTAAQEEFYLANPTASVWEVRNCTLFSQIEPPIVEIDTDEYREVKKSEMSKKSLQILGKFVSDYQLANAQCGVYDEEKSAEIVQKYRQIGTICRNLYYAFVEEVENCSTNAEIDACVDKYMLFYDEVTDEQ